MCLLVVWVIEFFGGLYLVSTFVFVFFVFKRVAGFFLVWFFFIFFGFVVFRVVDYEYGRWLT